MGQNLSQVEELIEAVEADPSDVDARSALVAALIDEDRIDEAEQHLAVLEILAPEDRAFVALDERIAEALGDSVRAARSRRHFAELVEEEVEAANHPSREQPRLRLLDGGAQDATRDAETHYLRDIAGLATVKAYISQILEEIHNTPGGAAGPWLGGALFYGPRGCGKAFCASVIAGELGADYVAVNFAESWSPNSLRQVVKSVVNAPSDRTTVLYLDGLDERFGTDHAAAIEPMLDMLDRARVNSCVAIFGSATLPWQVSVRVARPGRLGRVVLVLPPDAPARHLFLLKLFDTAGAKVAIEDIDWLAHQTEGHTFADLEAFVELVIGYDDTSHSALRKALQQVPPSSADWLTTAGHHALMNEAGGMYDDLISYFHARQRH